MKTSNVKVGIIGVHCSWYLGEILNEIVVPPSRVVGTLYWCTSINNVRLSAIMLQFKWDLYKNKDQDVTCSDNLFFIYLP